VIKMSVIKKVFLATTATAVLTCALPASSMAQSLRAEYLRAPAGSVNIHRDDAGMAHIYATREEDGFFGVGYAQASDGIDLLLSFILATQGRLAEQMGAERKEGRPFGAEFDDLVKTDMFSLHGRFLVQAKSDYPKLKPQLQRDLAAYIRGIEAYIADHPEKVPDWWPNERLPAYLPLAMTAQQFASPYMGWPDAVADCGLANDQLLPHTPIGGEAISDVNSMQSFGLGSQSNVWAISAKRTADNLPILSSDSHGGTRGLWAYGIDAGAFKFVGISGLAEAFPIRGMTPHVAWGWTSGGPDAGDCYRIKLEKDGQQYLVDGKRRALVQTKHLIKVRGGSPVSFVAEHAMINGMLAPVIAKRDGYAYAIAVTYLTDQQRWPQQAHAQVLARTMSEFVAATDILGGPKLNQMAASADGETYWLSMGRVPVRAPGLNPRKSLDGNTEKTAWQGIHPRQDLVQLRNPSTGYMHQNNEMPDTVTKGSPLKAENYRSYMYETDTRAGTLNLGDGSVYGRTARAEELLSRAYDISLEDSFKITTDVKLPWVDLWTGALAAAIAENGDIVEKLSPDARQLLGRAMRWNGVGDANSYEQLAYVYWREALAAGPMSGQAVEDIADQIETRKPLDTDQSKALINAFNQAAITLLGQRGTVDVKFGDLFRVGRGNVTYPMPMSELEPAGRYRGTQSLWLGFFSEPDAKGIRLYEGGSSTSFVAQMGKKVKAYMNFIPGISNDPSSPHYNDQARFIAERKVRQIPFYADEVEAAKKSSISVSTKKRD
jgi:acyl-homoserine-lactone acylase